MLPVDGGGKKLTQLGGPKEDLFFLLKHDAKAIVDVKVYVSSAVDAVNY